MDMERSWVLTDQFPDLEADLWGERWKEMKYRSWSRMAAGEATEVVHDGLNFLILGGAMFYIDSY